MNMKILLPNVTNEALAGTLPKDIVVWCEKVRLFTDQPYSKATIRQLENGNFQISADGKITIKPIAANAIEIEIGGY